MLKPAGVGIAANSGKEVKPTCPIRINAPLVTPPLAIVVWIYGDILRSDVSIRLRGQLGRRAWFHIMGPRSLGAVGAYLADSLAEYADSQRRPLAAPRCWRKH